MMLRLIARIDSRNDFHIKTIQCEGVKKIRKVSESLCKFSSGCDEHDEIVLIDTVASLYGSENWLLRNNVHCYVPIPLAVGGGIRSLDDAINTLQIGADKVIINSAALRNSKLLEDIVVECGTQALVLQVDTRKIDGVYRCFVDGARELSDYLLQDWILRAQSLGVGEIHVTSIDTEGTSIPFPLDLAEILAQNAHVPVVVSGGLRSPQHIKRIFEDYAINAFSFSSITNVLGAKILDVRKELSALGAQVRFP